MSRRILVALLLVSVIAVVATGCKKPDEPLAQPSIDKNYNQELAPGEPALVRIDPSQYPDFGAGWTRAKGVGLRKAVQYSIDYLHKPSSQKYYPLQSITHEQVLRSLEIFLSMLDSADTPDALNTLIRDNFDVYMSVGCDKQGTVLFTGYYTPIFDGSLERTERFQYPLYRMPADLQKDEEGELVGGPWKTRQEIDTTGLLAGNEIAWLGDRFEAYVVSVQGSGFLRLPDGTLYELGYAGNNGHEYTSIIRLMQADGVIDRYRTSLDNMIRYFKDHPEDLDRYLFQNQRYVFFQDSKGGPFGSIGQPVTAYHSVATDKEIFPRGALAFVDTRVPNLPDDFMRPYRNFVLDQDRGAAIRAPGRCDIYMGVGEEAGKTAGFTYSEGKLYYLIAKEGVAPDKFGAQPPPTAP